MFSQNWNYDTLCSCCLQHFKNLDVCYLIEAAASCETPTLCWSGKYLPKFMNTSRQLRQPNTCKLTIFIIIIFAIQWVEPLETKIKSFCEATQYGRLDLQATTAINHVNLTINYCWNRKALEEGRITKIPWKIRSNLSKKCFHNTSSKYCVKRFHFQQESN